MRAKVRVWGVGICLGLGCPAADQQGGEETTGSTPDDTGTLGTFGDGQTGPGPTSGTDESGVDSFFIPLPDVQVFGCDNWAQDCQDGEKCTAWVDDGGSAWNATKCVAIDGDLAPGDTCTVVGDAGTGVDDCGLGSMCWDVDENNQGICVALCKGTPDSPVCDDPMTDCAIFNEGVLNLCLSRCNPVIQSCVGDDLCIPSPSGTFVCVLDADPAGDVTSGDGCMGANTCNPGLWCGDASLNPNCDQSVAGCCLEFCDTEAANDCPGAALGVECTAWFPEGEAPPMLETVGACILPP